ncbi:hypothetical protein Rhopal_005597-T1 [Rhodotorula paludigena]|uniref:Mtf2-like C-terminal domain-containing protein n=1 Tax=Rhodotorula paludigena TaxID=86838 RepID=A0AAV5GSS9_9BASI|nr:hypothetical protein Rhopal_005597-T1 [Rhodotorula paludigena]
MQRVLAATARLRPATRAFSSSPCWCQPDSGAPEASTSAAATEPSSSSTAYSLPHDAFSSAELDAAPRPSARSVPRQRQRQTLSDAEARAFADLLGELLPRSTQPPATPAAPQGRAGAQGQPSGMFDIFNPAAHSPDVPEGVNKVQQALMRRVGHKMGMHVDESSGKWERKQRSELTEPETLELDRLREELFALRSDKDVLEWGMREVFGYTDARTGILADPAALPISAPTPDSHVAAAAADATTVARGPSSRIFPDLLLLLFLVLRDAHANPHAALSVFSLAASNPFSYINGCTTALYLEVLRTRWAQGDVEQFQAGLDEMRSGGVPLNDKVRDLVRAVGEAMRADEERAELRVDAALASAASDPSAPPGAAVLDSAEREARVLRARFFGPRQVRAWTQMERIVEENLGELERARRAREDERWHAAERARRDRDGAERDQALRERPDFVSRAATLADEVRPQRERRVPRDRFVAAAAAPPSSDADGLLGRLAPKLERDEDGNVVLPKPPPFVNQYKIRRQNRTREEKARRDHKHPALWWRK